MLAMTRHTDKEWSMNTSPEPHVLTIFDLVIPALVWWWWSNSGWPSVGALAMGLSGWVGGAFLTCIPSPAFKLLGGLVQWCGGMLGAIAVPWLLIVAVRWAWLQLF